MSRECIFQLWFVQLVGRKRIFNSPSGTTANGVYEWQKTYVTSCIKLVNMDDNLHGIWIRCCEHRYRNVGSRKWSKVDELFLRSGGDNGH